MKTITQEWINKAEGDFATAQRELQVQDQPNYDAVRQLIREKFSL